MRMRPLELRPIRGIEPRLRLEVGRDPRLEPHARQSHHKAAALVERRRGRGEAKTRHMQEGLGRRRDQQGATKVGHSILARKARRRSIG